MHLSRPSQNTGDLMSTETTDGRVAVITGVSSGIGAATAPALIAGGLRVALMARRAPRISRPLPTSCATARSPSRPTSPTATRWSPPQQRVADERTKQAPEQLYGDTPITTRDIGQIIAFAVSRPCSVSLNEILVRPTSQSG
jgi:NADP-dependent 3-hydroxy acid dehydrogenase YdfG